MKAFRVESPDGEFREVELPRPTLKPTDVLVRIHASGINPLDLKIRSGAAAHAKMPLPAVLGVEMAGTIEQLGTAAKAFRCGDEVYGMVGGVGGLQGTLAEFVAVPEALLARKPKNLSMRQAAALPLNTITAWEGLVDRAKVRPDHTVLIHAGAGGVGHIAIQLAKASAAKVFATVSPQKTDIVKRLGAVPIDYRSTSTVEYLESHTDGHGFDIVYDTVGGPTLDASFIAVKRYTGHVVSCLGWSSHSLAPLSMRGATYSGVFTLLPLLTGEDQSHHGQVLAKAALLAESGGLKPLLSERSFNTHQIAEAYESVAAGQGKAVVEF